jgi:hypothetical protein
LSVGVTAGAGFGRSPRRFAFRQMYSATLDKKMRMERPER